MNNPDVHVHDDSCTVTKDDTLSTSIFAQYDFHQGTVNVVEAETADDGL